MTIVINTHFHPHTPVQSSQLVAGAGCTLLLEAVSRVICDPGDVVLTPAPIWPVFSSLFAKSDASLSIVSSLPSSDESVHVVEDALKEMESLLEWTVETQRIWEHHVVQLVADNKHPRALLLSNPQNPLGRCYPRSFLLHALEFCEKVKRTTTRVPNVRFDMV